MHGVIGQLNDAVDGFASHGLSDVQDVEMSGALLMGGNDPTAVDQDPFNGISEGSTFEEKMLQKRKYDEEMFEIAKLKR